MITKNLRHCLLAGIIFFSIVHLAIANDGIFPPAPEAANTINFDGKGFIVDGKRTFIASGGMEYARVPRALWRDRLLRMKRAGFNCTETYIFWNFHEPTENVWNFKGDHDLNAYLQLVHQLSMYAIVRVGPYVCAEWDSGGYPVWLRFKPGVMVRTDNQPFLDETFKYYDQVIPIVAANQINHGGAVIMVQIENEDGDGWGTDHSLYEEKLRDKVLSLGVEVPTFFSGLHHGGDPPGDTPWDDATRTNPWFTTEFWCDWYNSYGDRDFTSWTRSTWKILAFGGNGYNYYMLHGGTNFGNYNNNEDAASYDYGAAIGQAGDLRTGYYQFKEAAMFAGTFQSILENSVSSTPVMASIATNTATKIYARTGDAGSIAFVDNNSGQDTTTQITGGLLPLEPSLGPATVKKQLMLPVVRDFQLTKSIKIVQSVTQILTTVTNGSSTTLVVYGPAGGNGSVELESSSALSVLSGSGWTAIDSTHGALEFTYPADGAASTVLANSADKLQVLVMSDRLADRTWPISTYAGTELIVGPDYVGPTSSSPNGQLTVDAEYTSSAPSAAVDYRPDLTATPLKAVSPQTQLPAMPVLINWQQSVVNEDSSAYDDSQWLTGAQPPYMGADGDYSAYAWYRTIVTGQASGPEYLLPAGIRDRAIAFVDGQRITADKIGGKSIELDLTPGSHSISILAIDYGRNKLVGYAGPIDTIDATGLAAPVRLSDAPDQSITAWQNLPVVQTKPDMATLPADNDPNWQPSKLGVDIFNHTPGWVWYRTTVPTPVQSETAGDVSMHFDCVDDNATVFCNGKDMGTHQGWDTGFDIDLTSAWLSAAPNVITVLDENVAGAGGMSGQTYITEASLSSATLVWKMRGGIGEPSTIKSWKPLGEAASPAPPTFFQAHFSDQPPSVSGPYPILRVHLGGMSAGFVWLNGHNLGRYPEKIPVDGLYLPECWINKGDNVLTIFDEDGMQPSGVNLYRETAASRYGFTLTN